MQLYLGLSSHARRNRLHHRPRRLLRHPRKHRAGCPLQLVAISTNESPARGGAADRHSSPVLDTTKQNCRRSAALRRRDESTALGGAGGAVRACHGGAWPSPRANRRPPAQQRPVCKDPDSIRIHSATRVSMKAVYILYVLVSFTFARDLNTYARTSRDHALYLYHCTTVRVVQGGSF